MERKHKRTKVGKRLLAGLLAAVLVLTGSLVPGQHTIPVQAASETKTELTDAQVRSLYQRESYSRQSVHDPSIVTTTGSDGKTSYYVFGTMMGVAKTTDLMNWKDTNVNGEDKDRLFGGAGYNKAFEKNALTGTQTLYGEDGTPYEVEFGTYNINTWLGSSDLRGKTWAPDVIYNEKMEKWCMYYSITDNAHAVIVLLTADNIEGPYEYQAPVVFGGFNNNQGRHGDYRNTDMNLVEGALESDGSLPGRYTEVDNWGNYWVSDIDPCVFYDDEGRLWMSYGSWSGGIFMLALDERTGLRDYSIKYESDYEAKGKAGVTDPYFGKKIAGGCYVSGEGSYIEKIGNYYYLFMSYGFYSPTGGYNMRVFRSEKPEGPYVDSNGNSALYSSWQDNYRTTSRGVQLMNNYQWHTMDVAEIAQGHNSAYADSDGNSYVIYHTKFANDTAGHELRVHQLYQNEDGWIVAAPYEYAGEKVNDEIIASTPVASSEITGDYDLIVHQYNNPKAKDEGTVAANVDIVKPVRIRLTADGKITGAYAGSWQEKEGTAYATIVMGGKTYKGVFAEQKIENTNIRTMCFTAVCEATGESIWGSRDPADDVVTAYHAAYSVPSVVRDAVPVDTQSLWGAEIVWESSNEDIVDTTGKVYQPEKDTEVILTRTVSKGSYYYKKRYAVNVCGRDRADKKTALSYSKLSAGETIARAEGLGDKTGLSLSFTAEGITSDWTGIFETKNHENVFLSVLNYGGVNIFEGTGTLSSEAKSAGYNTSNAWTIFTGGKSMRVTISYNVDGSIGFYRDDTLMLTYGADTAIGSNKVSDLSKAMLQAAKNGEIQVRYDITDVSVSAARDGADLPDQDMTGKVKTKVQGDAFLDSTNLVTVSFTPTGRFTKQETVAIDGKTAKKGDVAGNFTIQGIAVSEKDITVRVIANPVSGWHAIPGELEMELMSAEGKKLAGAEISYRLDALSGQGGYQPVAIKGNNDHVKAYYKAVGTKLYFLTITTVDKIHSDAVTAGGVTYVWSDGINSEIYMTIAEKKYSVGSHVYQGKYANPITWGDDVQADLIRDGSSVTRGYVAYGTFDDDSDVDQGCVLLNVVDLADINYTESGMEGLSFTLSGYMGANDGGDAFAVVDDARTYRIEGNGIPPYISGIQDGKTYCGGVSFIVSDDDLGSVTIDGETASGDMGVYHIAADQNQPGHSIVAMDAKGNRVVCTITVNDGHTWEEEYTVDKKPTATEEGSKSIHCSICDTIKEDSITAVPATGSGDGGNAGNAGNAGDSGNTGNDANTGDTGSTGDNGSTGNGNTGTPDKPLVNRIVLPKKSYTYTTSSKKRSFSLKAKATGGVLSYQSNSKKVTVNGRGLVTIRKNCVDSAVITVTAKGNGYQTVTARVSVTVKPAKIKGLRVKKGRKKLTIRWRKNAQASGTEIQYSKSRKFAKKKTKKKTVRASATKLTIKKLKGTYYVRVRTYARVKVDGRMKTLYSAWTKKKKVKVRK